MKQEFDIIKANRNSATNTVPALTNPSIEVMNMAKASLPKSNSEIKICLLGCKTTKRLRRGYCGKHYFRLWKHGDPLLVTREAVVHGQYKTRAYSIWRGMKSRCEIATTPAFSHYGGRGIKVCERWSSSFQDFFADMGEPPPRMSLDRIDNDGNYEPGNCRWATQTEQTNNTRRNRHIEFKGRVQSISMWTREMNLPAGIISRRLKDGWTVEDALTRPSIERKVRPIEPQPCLNCGRPRERKNYAPSEYKRKIFCGKPCQYAWRKQKTS